MVSLERRRARFETHPLSSDRFRRPERRLQKRAKTKTLKRQQPCPECVTKVTYSNSPLVTFAPLMAAQRSLDLSLSRSNWFPLQRMHFCFYLVRASPRTQQQFRDRKKRGNGSFCSRDLGMIQEHAKVTFSVSFIILNRGTTINDIAEEQRARLLSIYSETT